MNDLDQLRELRAELPYPERSRLTPGRTRLLSAARRPPRRFPALRLNTRLLLPATAAAAAVLVAAGVVGYSLSTGSTDREHAAHAPRSPKQVTQPSQAMLAARVLHDAAAAASRVPPKATPSPGQWIYSKLVGYEYKQGVTGNENWITFDGTKTAYYQSGALVVHTSPETPPANVTTNPLAAFGADATPQTAYYALASLPREPSQLLAAVAKAAEAAGGANSVAGTPIAGHAPQNRGQLEFDYLTLLMWNAAGGVGAPPSAEAAAFRAMAAIPGVTVQQSITDSANQPAIGVSDDGGYDQLLLDPVSYQVLGLRQISDGIGPKPAALSPQRLAQFPKAVQQKILRELKNPPAGPPKGTVIESLAYAQVSEVSGPGVK